MLDVLLVQGVYESVYARRSAIQGDDADENVVFNYVVFNHVDDVVVRVGSRRHADENVDARRSATLVLTTVC